MGVAHPLRITYLGTTVLLLDDGEDQLMIDAYVSRPHLLKMLGGTIRTQPAVVEAIAAQFDLSRVRAICASHSHFDHVLDLPAFALLTGADVHSSPSALNVARGGGVPEHRLHDFAIHPRFQIGAFDVQVIPSLHSKPTIFNNDLGQTINQPLQQPARAKDYKEGGSFDFLITHPRATLLVRPSFNYLPGQLDGIHADILLQGVTHIHKAGEAMQASFFAETLDKVGARTFIPLHWDNFFTPLLGPQRNWPFFLGDFRKDFALLETACTQRGVAFMPIQPLTTSGNNIR